MFIKEAEIFRGIPSHIIARSLKSLPRGCSRQDMYCSTKEILEIPCLSSCWGIGFPEFLTPCFRTKPNLRCDYA